MRKHHRIEQRAQMGCFAHDHYDLRPAEAGFKPLQAAAFKGRGRERCRSRAAARLRADCLYGNAPTTRVRRLISRRVRSHGDKGYRGHNYPNRFRIWISGQVRRVTKVIRHEMRRRAAVEPVIGHLRDDHRMRRNYLKGRLGLKQVVVCGARIDRSALISVNRNGAVNRDVNVTVPEKATIGRVA